jgi:hypothetical protein
MRKRCSRFANKSIIDGLSQRFWITCAFSKIRQEDDVEIMKIEASNLRMRVEESGAIPLSEAEIFILSDWVPGPLAKERVHFVSNGELEKLIVNVFLVIIFLDCTSS